MEQAASILTSIQDPAEGLAVAHALRDFSGYLRTLEAYLTITSIKNRNIRELFVRE